MGQVDIRVDEDIVLRLHQEKMAPLLFEFVDTNRIHLREWLPWLDHNTKVEDSEKFISECQENYKKKTSLNLGIYYHDTLVGSIGFNILDKVNRKAEIGYMLGEKWTGKGIMRKSCKTLVNYGFNDLNLNRIVIKAATGNKKSRSIPEKMNFHKEGVLQQAEFLYDRYVDVVVYGMLKENWI